MAKAPKRPFRLHLTLGRWWAVCAVVVSLVMLAAAWGFQIFAKLDPCPLCLRQREIYWMALGVAFVSAVWAYFTGARGSPRVFHFVLFAIFFTGALMSGFHIGVEQGYWPGPKTCGLVSGLSITPEDLLALAHGAKVQSGGCEKVAWSLFGISMAGYNLIISVIMSASSLLASFRPLRLPV